MPQAAEPSRPSPAESRFRCAPRGAHRYRLSAGEGRDGSAACGIYQVAGCRYEGRMSSKNRTIVVDDEALSRRGLEIRLLGTQDFEIVSQCANAREAIAAIGTHQP